MKKLFKRILIGLAILILIGASLMGYTMIKIKQATSAMATIETGKIADGIYALDDGFSNMFLIENNGKYVAIDAAKKSEMISEELTKLQIDPKDVMAVFLTHTDNDHTGALDLFTNAEVYISGAEEQLINGSTKRMGPFANRLKAEYKLMEDKEIIQVNGIFVCGILTEGHTPGSMCFEVNSTNLFIGDAACLKDGKLGPFSNFFDMDSESAVRSQKNLEGFDSIQYIFTAHCGYTDNYSEAF